MDSPSEFRCGNLRFLEWPGFWKATPDASLMTEEEWDEGWASLTRWLSSRYLLEYKVGWQSHCWVEGDYAEPERTLKIIIAVDEVLTVGFLRFVQEWTRKEAPLWRVSVPTDNTDENLILVYPDAIRVNPIAESNLEAFVAKVRPCLAALIEDGRKQFGLSKKPHPPLP